MATAAKIQKTYTYMYAWIIKLTRVSGMEESSYSLFLYMQWL